MDKSIEAACQSYAYQQLHKLEALAAKILDGDKSLMPEFIAVHSYLLSVGLVK